jgi:pterin-4a-carbinolamine dehydratase
LELFQRVGQVAEAEGHHPDLHLEGQLLLLLLPNQQGC